MVTSIELQVISKILTSDSKEDVEELCEYDASYYSVFKEQYQFILDHHLRYGNAPDVFTFRSEFPDVELVVVGESNEYLISRLKVNKKHIMLVDMFNRIKDLGADDTEMAWKYIQAKCDEIVDLDSYQPMDIIHQAQERSDQIIEFSKQSRIPTGFDEIDKLMYGGLSTVEELVIILARTNTGKSWVCTKMMESAQRNGFPCLYYSPEMQASILGIRFDTWRGHFQNSQLHRGNYDDEYRQYISSLSQEETPAFILEDKDVESGVVNVNVLQTLVRRYNIKLLIIDGLSYVEDSRGRGGDPDHIKYKNICQDLFKLSKMYGCAVVISMQANRETKDMKDDKGEVFPNMYAIEGSDHPARIATQVFAVRQIFDKHVLDIRLEKSRTADNQKPVLSYSWDINTGRMTNIPGDDDGDLQEMPTISAPSIYSNKTSDENAVYDDSDFDDDVEF